MTDPEQYALECPEEAVIGFFKYFSEDFPQSVKKNLCEDTGCLDYGTFLQVSSMEIKRSAMGQILKKYYIQKRTCL